MASRVISVVRTIWAVSLCRLSANNLMCVVMSLSLLVRKVCRQWWTNVVLCGL